MEVNAAATGSALAEKVKYQLDKGNISIATLAREIHYSRTTVSRYLCGKYDSDPSDIETQLTCWLTDVTGQSVDILPQTRVEPKRSSFFETRDAKNVLGLCQSCQEYTGLGIVVGRSGYGKTHALKQYAKLASVAYIECDDTMSSRDLVEAIEKCLGIPGGYGTIWRRVNGIRDFFNANRGYLLVIDEADKLISKNTQKKMEILRAIFDQSKVGVVIAGEPKLEAQIKSYLARMANRVDFYAALRGISPGEVEQFLVGYPIEADALLELKARACNPQTGCFRLLDRTLNNVFRLLSDGDSVTLKTIQQASGMMML